ncbi:hypothetical protein HOD38_02075 [archaeon]|jgi:hypothetical protein|nr:hypothetical protein [archaeon]MBT4397031.1 hypothetical protein [archaeon]MBT4441022.1 hypothetical protein [archaeon]
MTEGTEDNFTYFLMTLSGYAVTRAVDESVGVGYYHIIDPRKIEEGEPLEIKQAFHLGPFRHETLEGIMGELKEFVEREKTGTRFLGGVFHGPENL